ncbi:MAG TPA: LysM peptidoglycan-binding domain-containing protein [Candidatus Melainabacteria bacterium]|mgnify:CR=1 FL=1|jgi:hypothetical protein|nr:LysM peptidoglycan-binding domain-containing protein [Candidatus Melainabacteria bacterium]HIN67179.1 LysM peptidoglycan-binding domain-containing protein [Candidatus Obscuribacterales bacterium]
MRHVEYSGADFDRHQTEQRSETNGLGIEALRLLDQKAARNINEKDGWAPASVLDSSGKKVYASWAAEILDAKQYTVRAGDSLYQVARRSLGVTGKPDATQAEIKREMNRITELNKKDFPELKKGRVCEGATLILEAPKVLPATQVEATSASRNDVSSDSLPPARNGDCVPKARVAVKDAVVHAEKCDNFELFENGIAVVRPGADVIVNSGGRAFVFGGRVSARVGATVIAVGGDVDAQPGSRVRYVTDTRATFR